MSSKFYPTCNKKTVPQLMACQVLLVGTTRCTAGTIYDFELVAQCAVIASDGLSTAFPSVIRVPDWISSEDRAAPAAQCYMYYGNHSGQHIRLKWAEAIEGPWAAFDLGGIYNGISRRGVCDTDADVTRDAYDHASAPDVHVDHVNQQIIMYFHGENQPTTTTSGGVVVRKRHESFVATSGTGINFNDPLHAGGELGHGPKSVTVDDVTRDIWIGEDYKRAFQKDGNWHSTGRRTIINSAPDPFDPWVPAPGNPLGKTGTREDSPNDLWINDAHPGGQDDYHSPGATFLASSEFANHPRNPLPGERVLFNGNDERLNHVAVDIVAEDAFEIFFYVREANSLAPDRYDDIYRIVMNIGDPDFREWDIARDAAEQTIFDVVVAAEEIYAAVVDVHGVGFNPDDYDDPTSLGDTHIFVDEDDSKYLFFSYVSDANGVIGEGQITAIKLNIHPNFDYYDFDGTESFWRGSEESFSARYLLRTSRLGKQLPHSLAVRWRRAKPYLKPTVAANRPVLQGLASTSQYSFEMTYFAFQASYPMLKFAPRVLLLHSLAALVMLSLSTTRLVANEASAKRDGTIVKAWIKSGKPSLKRVRTLSDLTDFQPLADHRLNEFGGSLAYPSVKATGFFRTQKIDGRWWLIDPQGRRFLHIAVNSVKPYKGPTFRKAFPKKFASEQDWAMQTAALLKSHGFNGTGAWTDDQLLQAAPLRQVYTPSFSFMGSFGRKLKLAKQGSGHQSYKDRLIPVFHPDFPAHCREVARRLGSTKEDPYLLGIFSDNELEYNDSALDLHLQFPPDSPERKAATDWLTTHHPGKNRPSQFTENIRLAYVGFMFETYFDIVSRAIREVDPNHLYLGSRLHGAAKDNRWILAAAGRHLDAVAMNVYGVWTPTKPAAKWGRWSGKPVIVTEFYAKGQDSGLANLSGAGWTVPTQSDRGKFYQHFTLGLLESRACVGWHYFKYADNDPLDLTTDPSNRDSNKGILSSSYEPWNDFLGSMKAINEQAYALVASFDSQRTPAKGSGR